MHKQLLFTYQPTKQTHFLLGLVAMLAERTFTASVVRTRYRGQRRANQNLQLKATRPLIASLACVVDIDWRDNPRPFQVTQLKRRQVTRHIPRVDFIPLLKVTLMLVLK
jgi:hypothetical protein